MCASDKARVKAEQAAGEAALEAAVPARGGAPPGTGQEAAHTGVHEETRLAR
ncbi:hypothetical protein GCM10010384_47800 [Streptomyces djakartensis]|uniref:Uncharacterized protein n=1 Tax=Streptomyces djakartensis TaxID=68193 RepID=A0ABQ3A5K8_9ACTN|nr:hypothetical protein GCM10010384_47800 [Streptomyces djakartensis]